MEEGEGGGGVVGGGGGFVFFFFKQKTAYEIYQCDWSSDVCSSDLIALDSFGIGVANIYNLVYEMMSKFEDKEFAEILPGVLEWKSVISYLARHYPNENTEIQTVMEPFINLISAALAVKTVENAEEEINELKERYARQCKLFDTFIQNYKKEFYIKYYQPDTHILSFVKEINAQVVRGL